MSDHPPTALDRGVQTVTMALTSCGRPDLLEPTLDRLFASGREIQIAGAIVIEDAGDVRVAELCARKYRQVRVLLNPARLGQMAAIDTVYAEVQTPFVFHMEDDWHFDALPDFAPAIDLLNANPEVSGVCLRAFDEIGEKFRRHARQFDHAGARFAVFPDSAHPSWFGYTFNPSLVRLSTWEALDRSFASWKTEEAISIEMRRRGQRLAYMLPGLARHSGDGRHVDDPHVKKRAKTVWSKLNRSIEKRWRRWTGKGGPLGS